MRNPLYLGLLALLFLLPATASAQEGLSASFRISPSLSFGRQFINDRQVDSMALSPSVGIAFGVDIHHGFNDNVGIFTGVGLSVRPIGNYRDYSLHPLPQTLTLTYLEIPLGLDLSSYDIGAGYYIKAKAGVTFDILTGANFKGPDLVKYSGRIWPMNISALGGIGVEKDLQGAGYLFLGLSYHHGLFNILKTDYEIEENGVKSKPLQNHSIRLSYFALDLAYIFR